MAQPTRKVGTAFMARKETLDGALQHTREWFGALLTRWESAPPNALNDATFWREDEGAFYLRGVDDEEYARCLENLATVVGRTDAMEKEAVAQALQTALFTVVDIPGKRSTEPKARIEDAIRELRRALTGPLLRFQVYIPVSGLDPVGLPTRVGTVDFAVFEESFLLRFPQGEAELRSESEVFGRTVAITEVEALEWGGAQTRGVQVVRLVVDSLNFFSDMVRYNQAHLILPGDAPKARLVIAQRRLEAGMDARWRLSHGWVGGQGQLSLTRLREADARQSMGFPRVEDLLGRKRNKLEDQLIASIQWAGRATVAARREEAFLLYAIALESFVLADQDPLELGYRLRLRVAHLLGKTPEARKELFDQVAQLYAIRSKIVHSGEYRVSEVDLGRMRWICKAALLRACTSEDFDRMSTAEDLQRWFQDRLLD